MPGQYTWVINQMNAVEDRPNSIVQAYMYNIITVPVSNFLCSSNLTASIQLSNVNLLLYCAPSIWSVEFAWVGLDQAQCAVNELKQRLCGSSFIRAAEGACFALAITLVTSLWLDKSGSGGTSGQYNPTWVLLHPQSSTFIFSEYLFSVFHRVNIPAFGKTLCLFPHSVNAGSSAGVAVRACLTFPTTLPWSSPFWSHFVWSPDIFKKYHSVAPIGIIVNLASRLLVLLRYDWQIWCARDSLQNRPMKMRGWDVKPLNLSRRGVLTKKRLFWTINMRVSLYWLHILKVDHWW